MSSERRRPCMKCNFLVANNYASLIARYVTARAPLKELTRECMMPSQKYTSSQHGNKCLKEEIRSVTKVVFVSKDKASLVRKDTTGHVKKISPGGSGFLRPSATAQVFLNKREYTTLFSLYLHMTSYISSPC